MRVLMSGYQRQRRGGEAHLASAISKLVRQGRVDGGTSLGRCPTLLLLLAKLLGSLVKVVLLALYSSALPTPSNRLIII